MRDIALAGIVFGLLLMAFKQPVIGAYLWAWLSLMSPHKMTWGFAFGFPFAQITAVVTLLALLVTRQRRAVPINAIVVLQLSMLGWMSFTSLFALADRTLVIDRWVFVLKIHLMLVVTWMLVRDARQLRVLIWVVTLSVVYFGIKGGFWTLLTGGGGRVWGPPGGMLQENNALAVALVMLTPFLYFLRQTEGNAWVRRGLDLAVVLCAFSILGSQSRGALIALLAMAFVLGLKGKHPVGSSAILLSLVALTIAFMPDSWSNRMETIQTYQQDTSAMSRLWAWQTMWNAAVDRPLVGVGFMSDNATVFSRYAPIDGVYSIFAGQIYVAHSIYFQMLGEHGFVGLGMFLALLATTWIAAGRIAARTKDDPEFKAWMPLLMRMVQVSLVGFAAGGAFLSIAYLDLPYYIIGYVVLAAALLKDRASTAETSGLSADPSTSIRRDLTAGLPRA